MILWFKWSCVDIVGAVAAAADLAVVVVATVGVSYSIATRIPPAPLNNLSGWLIEWLGG